MKYLRVYADAAGDSHFEDVEIPTTTSRSPVSEARVEISEWMNAAALVFRRVVTDHPDTPHVAPRRQFVVHLAGHGEIEVSSGERRAIGPGDVVLVEDTTGKGHITRRCGEAERVTLCVAVPDDQP